MATKTATEARAYGRSLKDFPSRNAAERKLISCVRKGKLADFGNEIPKKPKRKSRTIRAGLVRFLALGGDDKTPVHEHGVQIQGAVVAGALDFDGCNLVGTLQLEKCILTESFKLRDARTRTVNLGGSLCKDIAGDRAEISGSLLLRNQFRSEGPIRLVGMKIKGNLDCDGGKFEGQREQRNALECDRIKIDGNLFLRKKFSVTGTVSLVNAAIGGDVSCNGGIFKRATLSGVKADALRKRNLILARATVKGSLWLGGRLKTTFQGGVDLTGATIERIIDGVTVQTQRRVPGKEPSDSADTPAFLELDGLTYDRFSEPTDQSASARVAFLNLQEESDLGADFRPQPWMQLVKVLLESGHPEAAREVAIKFEEQRRSAGKVNGLAAPLHFLYGFLVGYGHRPMRLVCIMLFVWSISAIVYQAAAEDGWFAPADPHYFQDERYEKCRPENGGNWITCRESASEYSTFNALAYSLDVLLPIVDLQQEKEWSPLIAKGTPRSNDPAISLNFGVFARLLMWFEVLFGWVASALLATVLAGLAKRMD